MKQICLIFLFFIAVIPSFSQNIETADDAIMSQLWNSMSEEQKSALIKEFLFSQTVKEQVSFYSEQMLKSAKKLKTTGKILALGGPAALLSGLGFIGLGDAADNDGFYIAGAIHFILAPAISLSGIPVFIAGARKERIYKAEIALSANEVKFVMNF